MCFNKEVSLLTFLIGTTISSKLLASNDSSKQLTGIYLLFLSLMQLVEFLIWIYFKNKKYNSLISYLIPITVLLQVLSMFIGGKYLVDLSPEHQNLSLGFTILFIFLTLIILYKGSKPTTINNSCKLKWNILDFHNQILSFFYCISYVIIISLNIYYAYQGEMTLKLFIGSFVASYVLLAFTGEKPSLSNASSFWCFFCLLLSGFYFIID